MEFLSLKGVKMNKKKAISGVIICGFFGSINIGYTIGEVMLSDWRLSLLVNVFVGIFCLVVAKSCMDNYVGIKAIEKNNE